MGPVVHTAVSLSIGAAAWAGGGSIAAIPIALITGVLPDVDHLVDYFDSKDEGRKSHMFRPFHAWEFLLIASIVALAFYSNQLFLVAILAYLSHLAIDQFANRVHPLAYTVTYRAIKKFRRRHLTPHMFDPRFRILPEPMPFWAKLEPSVWRFVVARRNRRQ